ncbi:unnamed protein product [Calicophoron daubneyi]|uniref:Ig-like domain-containing protein n=1 Tax=Calicophoron daubneyi TaxID=300641 RepID=A0AAV2TMQ2_CALDB
MEGRKIGRKPAYTKSWVNQIERGLVEMNVTSIENWKDSKIVKDPDCRPRLLGERGHVATNHYLDNKLAEILAQPKFLSGIELPLNAILPMQPFAWLPYLLYQSFYLYITLPSTHAVRGCVTYVTGEDYSMRQSICDKLDTHFQAIPAALPSQVVKLTVNHQDIVLLNASQFAHLPNLTYLDLDSNKIAKILPDTFRGLRYLRTLSLRFNLLTLNVESFHPDVIRGLGNLEHLNLMQNPIGFVPSQFFAPIGSSLRTLVLAGASDEFQLDVGALTGLQMLQVFDISYCHLETLSETFEHSFNNMQLKELYIYGNPWRCDCHLRWLKVWFLKYGTKFTYSRPVPEGISKEMLEPGAQQWYNGGGADGAEDSSSLLQPRCASPYTLFGRPIFSHPSNSDLQPVRTTDFHCSPKALTANQQINLASGTNSTLICEFFADPTGIVVWYRNGTRVQSHWPRMTIQQSQGRNFQSELNIQNVQHEDAGTYVCFLDTGYGRVNATFMVFVNRDGNLFEPGGASGMFQWIGSLNTTLVLKYTGITASCLVILLMLIGVLIYCFYGRHTCKTKQTREKQRTNSKQKCANGNHEAQMDGETPMVQSKPSNLPNPHSNLLRKRDLNMDEQPLVMTTSVSSIRLLPSAEKLENYVAFQILPSDPKTSIPPTCPIHNYALIQPLGSDTLLLQESEPRMTVTGQPVTTEQPRIQFPKNTVDAPQKIGSPVLEDSVFSEIGRAVPEFSTSEGSSQYAPCPLHGNLFATLQNPKRKEVFENSKRHISAVPTGLGSVCEKRNNTLPNRRKARPQIHTNEPEEDVEEMALEGRVKSTLPVSTFISVPDVTGSGVKQNGLENASVPMKDSNLG